MKGSLCLRLLFSLALAVVSVRGAWAVINPNFTPIHLVEEATCIAELELETGRDRKVRATVKRVIKGDLATETITLDLTKTPYEQHAAGFQRMIARRGKAPALLFIGRRFDTGPSDGAWRTAGPGVMPPEASEEDAKALLHVEGIWVEFDGVANGVWGMSQISTAMLGTWNGGTDMLSKAVEYVLADPDNAELPVTENVAWFGQKLFDKFHGAVGMMSPVDLDGEGKVALHVACESGDRLYVLKGAHQSLSDITASTGLAAKSKCAAWGDLNADGRIDLVSASSHGLVVYTQQSDGTFQPGPELAQAAIRGELLGLHVIDGPSPGRAVVMLNASGVPGLWTIERAAVRRLVDEPTAVSANLGRPGPFVVADLDGDALPDLLRVYEHGGLIHRGRAPGTFDRAKPCAVAAGQGSSNAFVGDFDADGLLDVVTVTADDRTGLWVNCGGFEFVERFASGGELSYKGDSGAIGGSVCDFNNDGRQDLVFYYAATGSHMYFNRGFRSFGYANGLDPGGNGLLPQGNEGQQAGCMVDLNGDGAQELVLILNSGEGWIFSLDVGDTLGLCVRGVLAPGGVCRGPVRATGWSVGRCLGAWNVVPGTSEGYVAQTEAGPIMLKWQFPGRAVREKEVILENRPVRLVLTP